MVSHVRIAWALVHQNCSLSRWYKERFFILLLNFLLQFNCEYLESAKTILHWRIREHYKQVSGFERVRLISSKKVGWINPTVSRHLSRSDAAVCTLSEEFFSQADGPTSGLWVMLSRLEGERYQVKSLVMFVDLTIRTFPCFFPPKTCVNTG